MVTPSDDGLQQIRDGIAGADRPWWQAPRGPGGRWLPSSLGVAVGAGVAFLGGDDEATATSSPVRRTAPPATAERVDPAERDADTERERRRPSRSRATSTSTTSWTTASPRGCSASSGPTRDGPGDRGVCRRCSSEPAVDPDYSSPWPAGTELLGYSKQRRHRHGRPVEVRQGRRRGRDGRRAAGRLHRDGERQVGEEGRAPRQRQDAGVRAQRLVAAGRRGPRWSRSRD